MASDLEATPLLAGPRGRRACFAWVREACARAVAPGELAEVVSGVDVRALASVEDPRELLPALQESVGWARYWQEPDEIDLALQDPDVAAVLEPVAAALAAAPASRWWTDPLAPSAQRHVVWDVGRTVTLPTGSAAELLRLWREAAVADELRARRERPIDPEAAWSGHWWSTPAMSGLVATTPTVPGSELAALLVLLEDDFGAERAAVHEARVAPDARVYEVTGPATWAGLVGRYPLGVTWSRRHDWFRTTGWRGAWAMPDWQAVAQDWDAVHLTVSGYLTAAGRALPVPGTPDDVRTVLAGWDPGTTWWLADLTELGPATWWRRDRDSLGWSAET